MSVHQDGSIVAQLTDQENSGTTKEVGYNLETFFNINLEMLAIAGIDGYFKLLNPVWTQTLGWSIEELTAEPFIAFVHPEDKKNTLREAQHLIDGHRLVSFRNRYRCKDGSYKWFLWSSTVVGEYYYAVARDITELVALEQKKEAGTENFLGYFIKHTPAAVAMLDTELRYVYVSDRWMADYGLEGILTGKEYYETFPSTTEAMKKIHQHCLNGEIVSRDKDLMVHSNDMEIWSRWTIGPWRDFEGVIGGIIIFSEVITKEVELRKKAEGVYKMAALGVMAAGLSHDMASPLSVLELELGQVQKQLPQTPEAERMVEYMRTALDHMKKIHNSLRNYAREGKTGDFVAKDIYEILETTQVLVENKIGYDITLTKKIPANMPEIICIPDKIIQVLVNLISNAVDAVMDLTETERWISLTVESVPGMVTFVVENGGPPIPVEVQQKMLQPFFTTKGEGKGTGLGLSICNEIVTKAHNGVFIYDEQSLHPKFMVQIPQGSLNPAI